METIPAWFWMTVIAFLTVLFGLILYYVAMLIRETTATMSEVKATLTDSRKLIQNANVIVEDSMGIVKDVKDSVSKLKGTVDEVNEMILVPVRKVGNILETVLSFVEGFISKK